MTVRGIQKMLGFASLNPTYLAEIGWKRQQSTQEAGFDVSETDRQEAGIPAKFRWRTDEGWYIPYSKWTCWI